MKSSTPITNQCYSVCAQKSMIARPPCFDNGDEFGLKVFIDLRKKSIGYCGVAWPPVYDQTIKKEYDDR